MAGRTIAVVVIGVQQWPALQPHVALVVAAVNAATPGSFTEVDSGRLTARTASRGQVRRRSHGSVFTLSRVASD
jgi:hypothetical protein